AKGQNGLDIAANQPFHEGITRKHAYATAPEFAIYRDAGHGGSIVNRRIFAWLAALTLAFASPAAGNVSPADLARAPTDASSDGFLRSTAASSYYNRGNAFLRADDYPRAIAAYTRAVRANPNDADSF